MTEQTDPALVQLVDIEQQLERLLVDSAEAGVPELVLLNVLRDYADVIDELGYVPRTWRGSKPITYSGP